MLTAAFYTIPKTLYIYIYKNVVNMLFIIYVCRSLNIFIANDAIAFLMPQKSFHFYRISESKQRKTSFMWG